MTTPTSTTTRLAAWWHGLAPRERAMVAIMLALLAAFAWWYGLLGPLRALRDGAEARYDRAAATLQSVEVDLGALATTGATSAAPAQGLEALQRRILDSARDAGLAPSRQRTAADGTFSVEFDRVASPALFAWLGTLADTHGIAPATLHIERADGQLHAEAGFAEAAP